MKRRPDGRWRKSKTINGEIVYFYSNKETERQAEKDIENQMLAYTQNINKNKHNFKILGEKMLEYKSSVVEYNTSQSYIYSFKYLEPLYDYNIEDVTPAMVQKLLDDMVFVYDYSASAVSKAKIVFGLIMDYAIVQEDLMLFNFTKSIKVSRKAKKGSVKSPSEDVIKTIIENAETVDFGLWPFVFLCTGLRRGEQAALRRKNINFDKNEISVEKSVEFVVNQPRLKNVPKTEESVGTVPILNILRPKLMKLCENLSPDDFIFGGEKPLTKTQIDKRLKKYCLEIGHTFTGHQMRHAYAQLLYEAGVDVKTAQRLLRHANFNTTMNIYTEFSKNKTEEAADLVNKYIGTQRDGSRQPETHCARAQTGD